MSAASSVPKISSADLLKQVTDKLEALSVKIDTLAVKISETSTDVLRLSREIKDQKVVVPVPVQEKKEKKKSTKPAGLESLGKYISSLYVKDNEFKDTYDKDGSIRAAVIRNNARVSTLTEKKDAEGIAKLNKAVGQNFYTHCPAPTKKTLSGLYDAALRKAGWIKPASKKGGAAAPAGNAAAAEAPKKEKGKEKEDEESEENENDELGDSE